MLANRPRRITSASVRPIHTTATARPARASSTSRVAASDATAMKTPWASPTTKRTPSRIGKVPDRLIKPLPTARTAMDHARVRRSRQWATRAGINGAPIAAPKA
ncbi:hypothetical protein G6F31_019110 [Rhizopus arrhizus]|nr:hypothetical protein G6F31_019110 [Rhizopus arrhizus]